MYFKSAKRGFPRKLWKPIWIRYWSPLYGTGSDGSDEDDDGAASDSEPQPRGEGELDVSTPTATGAESGGGGAVCPAVVLHGDPLTDRKSTFQAHAAKVKTTEQVSQF